MGRRKVSMGLIPNRRVRVGTFGKRKEGLQKKANELSVLCGVDVALVVASADVDALADVWESKEGVLARYRALAPEARARHTHRAYLECEHGKVEAKLARVRQGGPDGLGRWDRALDGVATAEEAQRLLDDVDAAIQATQDRRRALGMPAEEDDEGVVLEGVQPLGFATVDDGYLLHAPRDDTSNDDHQAMMWSGNGLFHHHQGNPAGMQSAGYGLFHQYSSCNGAGMEGYHLQMAPDMCGNSDAYQLRDAGAMQMQLGYGFHHAGYFGAPADNQTQPNLAMWSADEARLAMVPVECPSADAGLNYMETAAAHGAGSFAMGNFVNSPPVLSLAMDACTGGGGNFINASPAASSSAYTIGGSGDNFTKVTTAQPLAISYGGDLTNVARYATQWQPQCAGSNQNPSAEEMPYLSDLQEDTQLHLWGN